MRSIQFVCFFFFVVCLFGQKENAIDYTHADADIKLYTDVITGIVRYDFIVNSQVDSLYFDAIHMEFSNFYLGNKEVSNFSTYDGKKLAIGLNLKPGKYYIKLGFSVKPKQAVYFQGFEDDIEENQQIWTQGQGKYTSHWLPSFDDMNEKVEFDLTIHTSPKYTVIANGKLAEKKNNKELTSWHFNMINPMSSYLVAFAIGNFDKKELKSASGIPIELYYEPKDSLKVEPTYRYTKQIFDFLEKEINVPYPWQNYKQIPVQDFLYAGMENTSATIFSNAYMIDSTAFVDKNYVNVNAHELAHQWFGNLVTEQSGKHHWLQEGFATYYAYLAEQHLFGDDYFYWKLFETAKTLHDSSKSGKGQALNDPKASSLTFYEKGAWALVMLREQLGNKAFRIGVKNYLEKHQFKNVTITDFLKEMEAASNQDLSKYRQEWLENEKFPWQLVKEKLQKDSKAIALVFKMEKALQQNQSDDLDYETYWNKTSSINFKAYMIKEYHRVLPMAVLDKAFSSENIKLRQALSNSLYATPDTRLHKEQVLKFETLLEDKSYLTIENALIKLWSNFPDERIKYLDKTKTIVGLPNKNIRLLWLTLALITPEYKPEEKQVFYDELNGYTSEDNHFEVRQLSFQYLYQIEALSDVALLNLIKATNHHVWQFKKSSRNLVRRLAERTNTKGRLLKLRDSLTLNQQEALNQLIK